MGDTIHLFNGSKNLDDAFLLDAIADVSHARPVDGQPVEHAKAFLDELIEEAFETQRGQVNYRTLLQKVHAFAGMQEVRRDGKLIVIDRDLYMGGDDNWAFGAFHPQNRGLGYVLVSTARMETPVLAKQVVRHELGHMFGAPSEGRSNTTQLLGLHCVNDLCAMQQKTSVADAVEYAHAIEAAGRNPYCSQCAEDMQRYEAPV